MRVRVRLFASLREAAGRSELELECPANARVADALRLLQSQMPHLPSLAETMLAVNQEYVDPDFGLHDGDELAFIPPVSGGSQSVAGSRFEVRSSRLTV